MLPPLPNPPLHASLANLPEKDLVKGLIADPYWRERLFNVKDIPDAGRILQCQPLRSIRPDLQGDADIVVYDPQLPNVAAAMEVKRIKVGESAFAAGTPNKLEEFKKAVRQANQLASVGFAQVYLYVIVVVDSRLNNKGHYTYEGMTSNLRALVASRVSTESLDPRIGLVVFELVQAMDHPPLWIDSSESHLVRLAQNTIQASAVSAWLISRVQ